MPTLPAERLAGAYLYYDAAADDARLTLTILRTAALDHGAVVANHAGVVGLLKDVDGRAAGALVEADGRRIDVRARSSSTPPACGPTTCGPSTRAPPRQHPPAKGIHVTVPWHQVRNDIAVVIPVPKDKRSVFVVPWLPKDSGVRAHLHRHHRHRLRRLPRRPAMHRRPTSSTSSRHQLLARRLTEADVLGTWAGLRPLVKSATSGAPPTCRGPQGHRSESGVVTVTGGKLTTYRHMAADAVDELVERLGGPRPGRAGAARRGSTQRRPARRRPGRGRCSAPCRPLRQRGPVVASPIDA